MGKITPQDEEFRQFAKKQVIKHIQYYFDNVPMNDDEAVTILKSHLLIEEQLIKLVNIELKKPEALKRSRLTFHQLACIAEAMHWYDKDDWVWISVRKLNKIRNSLSHELKPKNLEIHIADFHRLIEKHCSIQVKDKLKEPTKNRLTMTIGLLYSYISAYLEACINTEAQKGNKKNNLV